MTKWGTTEKGFTWDYLWPILLGCFGAYLCLESRIVCIPPVSEMAAVQDNNRHVLVCLGSLIVYLRLSHKFGNRDLVK